MKNSLKALVVVAILAIAGMASAQNSANANGTANATVVCPISIVNNTNLEFGTITNSATGGTVVVPADPSGSAVYTNVAATTGSNAGPTPHSSRFTVGGQGHFSYSIAPTIVTNFAGVGATLSNLTWKVPGGIWSSAGVAGGLSPYASNAGPGYNDHSIMPCDPDADNDAYETSPFYTADDICGCVTDGLFVGGTLTLTSAANGTYVATINVAIAYN